MTGVEPWCPLELRMLRREGPSCTLAVDVDPAEVGMPLTLHQVMADLVDELELAFEDRAKGCRHLLGDDQPVDDRVAAAGGYPAQGHPPARGFRGGARIIKVT